MKNNIFLRVKCNQIERENSLKQSIEKIVKSAKNKKNFLSLFNAENPRIISENERKDSLFEITQKYFKTKEEVFFENENII